MIEVKIQNRQITISTQLSDELIPDKGGIVDFVVKLEIPYSKDAIKLGRDICDICNIYLMHKTLVSIDIVSELVTESKNSGNPYIIGFKFRASVL